VREGRRFLIYSVTGGAAILINVKGDKIKLNIKAFGLSCGLIWGWGLRAFWFVVCVRLYR